MSSETPGSAPTDRTGRILFAACRAVAAGGGLLLALAGVLTVVSVLGRYLFSLPIPGDFELVEIASGIGVFCFLPYCQMVRGNVIVDFVTANASPPVRGALDALGALGLAAVAALVAWRMTVGGLELKAIGEQTVLLQIPRYFVFYPAVLCLVLLAMAALYTIWASLRVARTPAAGSAR